ncbi:A-kinase anchor protein 13-like isoform X3 [Lineus longissimus]|uniref:A-kinase anchor protein 13-like isoform X3 n=1 Tax=Lineus longissimus TaxID=88925 RepID=UPI00315DB862
MEEAASKSKKEASEDNDLSHLKNVNNDLGIDLQQGCRMAFSPKESPIYGGNTIVVAFGENTTLSPDCELYLIFAGAKRRHITQGKIVNQQTLQATIPSHNAVESVQLLVCMYRDHFVTVLATCEFDYIYGSVHHMAEFLVDTVNRSDALENLDNIKSDYFNLSEESLSSLDDRLSSAFTHIRIPENWNLLGTDGNQIESSPRETLLHFAARLGLEKVASFLLDKPGSDAAASLPNHHGELPQDIARDLGSDRLADLLSENGHSSMVKYPSIMEPPDSCSVTREENGLTTLSLANTDDLSDVGGDIDRIRQIIHPTTRGISPDPPSIQQETPRSRSSSDDTPSDEAERISDESDDEDDEETFQKDQVRSNYHVAYANRPKHLRRQCTDPEYHHRSVTPSISLTSPQSGNTVVLEESIRQLHSINEGINRFRQLHQGSVQDARKDRLQRFSSSCPSLAEQQQLSASPGLIAGPLESGYHSSMLNIAQEQAGKYQTKDANMLDYNPQGIYNIDSSSSALTSNVKICINDVTLDSTEEVYNSQQSVTEFDELDKVKKKHRRKSWCPHSQGGNDTRGHRKASMLAVMGRSMSLSSLDSNDESSSTEEEDDDDQYHDAHELHPPGAISPCDQSPDTPSPISIGPPKANSTPSDPSIPRPSSAMNSSVGVRSLTDVRFDLNSDENSQTSPSPKFRPTPHRSLSPDASQSSKTNLVLPGSGNLTKSVSTPSIPSAKEEGKEDAGEQRVANVEGLPQGKTPLQQPIQKLVEEHDIKRRQSERLDRTADDILDGVFRTNRRRRGRHMSMVEFYPPPQHDSGHFEDDDSLKEGKGEKKRKSSVFSKLGSYRKDRKDKSREKEQKRSSHQYVSVSFSNSTSCDVCGKSMANKAALQCENCLVNVHENTCRDQISACTKFKQFKVLQRQGGPGTGSVRARNVAGSLPGKFRGQSSWPKLSDSYWFSGTGLKSSQSFKEKRVAPLQIKQNVPVSSSGQKTTSPPSISVSNTSYGHFQWRRVATKLGIDDPYIAYDRWPFKVINEENEDNQKDLDGMGSNIINTMSASMESLDDAVEEEFDFEDDTELMELQEPDPEAWSITVDKKTLKKMAPKDIKKQDHIWELILTEKHHCRTLKIMKTIFSGGMSKECQLTPDRIDKIFPKLDELLDIHLNFLQVLQTRQGQKRDMSFDIIGDLLCDQFGGDNGERLKEAYGEFCSRHKEAVAYYKDMLKNDRTFQGFIKKCSNNRLCKKLGIPECILLVTQRMTKYPLLLDPIIKTTKDKIDKENLNRALALSKNILNDINYQVGRYEKEQRLLEIYNRLDVKSVAWFRGRKFKKSDLLSRKLIHEGVISWKTARGKLTEAIAVVLSDLMFFLQENNQKYTFFTQDNKSAVIPLSKLLVREKGDTHDSRGIYLISQNKSQPEMYELVCMSSDKRKEWIELVQGASKLCPEEEEDVPSESEEEKRLQEERAAQVLTLVRRLEVNDKEIKKFCDEKIKIISKIMSIHGHEGIQGELQSPYQDEEKKEFKDPEELFQAASKEASKLQVMIHGSFAVGGLNRSVSSVGEQESIGYTPTPLPKRAETFTAFDTTRSALAAKKRGVYAIRDSGGRSTSLQNLNRQESDNDFNLTVDMSKQWAMRRGSAGVPQADKAAAQKDARNRRMSTSFLQNFLYKQNPNDESRGSDGGSDKSSVGDVSYSSYLNQPLGGAPCRELVHSLTQIMQYMHGIMVVSGRQRTQNESLKTQLLDSNQQLAKLSSEAQKQMLEKKNLYRHNQQLEELRSLQQTIRKEREDWEKAKEKERYRIEHENLALDEKQKNLDKQKAEIRKEAEELQRQKEALQRQVDFLKLQFSNAHQSSILSSGRHESESGISAIPPKIQTPTSSNSTPTSPSINHKRSASADFRKDDVTDSYEPMKPEYTQSLKEPLNRKSLFGDKSRPLSDGTLSGVSKKDLPLHLLSATNEQKTSSIRQQLPLKLAGLSGKSMSGGSGSMTSPKMSGLHHSSSLVGQHQQIPSKLASGSGSGKISHTASVPAMLPMKLAEDKGKSSRLSSPSMTSPTGKKTKEERKKESEVIYF